VRVKSCPECAGAIFLLMKERTLKALQIEVTSRCTRRCSLCPRAAFGDRWLEGDLSAALWKRIEPALSRAEHVHLQGWGEPLLHSQLPEMARKAKEAGATVGFTTNGDLLESAVDWIVDERVDLLTLSVAGRQETHSRFRGGSSLEQITEAFRALTSRARQSKSRIKAQISYLLTRENASDLPVVVERAVEVGAHELFVVHLDVTPTESLWNLAAFDRNGLLPGIEKYLAAAEKAARRHRLRFRGPAVKPEELLVCSLNPAQFAFVAQDGRVGPCVNLLLPIKNGVPRWGPAGLRNVEQVSYGRLQDAGLDTILAGAERMAFIEPFQKRVAAEKQFLTSITGEFGVEALSELEQSDRHRSDVLQANPFPSQCDGCHQQLGW
jgi:MoaA/NifB/PqqE/SkfB family radical SAM enzyme